MTTFEAARKATGGVRPGHDHGCKPVELIPGLWTAHFHDCDTAEKLKATCPKVTLVVNSASDKCPTKSGDYGAGIEVLRVENLLDDPDEFKKVDAMEEGEAKVAAKAALAAPPPEKRAGDAKKDFEIVNDAVEKAINAGGGAMIHCYASISRSMAFILAYIMKTKRISLKRAIVDCKEKWSATWPNDTFLQQLVDYEKELKAKPLLRKPKFGKVTGIKPDSRGLNLKLKVVKSTLLDEAASKTKTWEVVAGDASGVVTVKIIDEDKAEACKDGANIRIQNARVIMIGGYIRVIVDKWGVLKPLEESLDFEVNTGKDMSATEYEMVK